MTEELNKKKNILKAIVNCDPKLPRADLFQEIAATTLVFESGVEATDLELFNAGLDEIKEDAGNSNDTAYIIDLINNPKSSEDNKRKVTKISR